MKEIEKKEAEVGDEEVEEISIDFAEDVLEIDEILMVVMMPITNDIKLKF